MSEVRGEANATEMHLSSGAKEAVAIIKLEEVNFSSNTFTYIYFSALPEWYGERKIRFKKCHGDLKCIPDVIFDPSRSAIKPIHPLCLQKVKVQDFKTVTSQG